MFGERQEDLDVRDDLALNDLDLGPLRDQLLGSAVGEEEIRAGLVSSGPANSLS